MLDTLSFLFSISIIGIITLVKIGFWLFIIEYNKKTIVSRKHSYLIWNVYIGQLYFAKTLQIFFFYQTDQITKNFERLNLVSEWNAMYLPQNWGT